MDTEKILNEIVTLLIIPILPAVSTFIIAWFKAKTDEIRNRIQNDTIAQYIDILDFTVESVVMALNQTTVEGMKNASKDGKLTKEEAILIKQQAMNEVYKVLGSTGKATLSQVFENLDALISNKIEALISSTKTQK